MPRGKKKEVKVKDPSKATWRWTPRKWAEQLAGAKGIRALAAAGPDFSKRVTTAHGVVRSDGEIAERIARLRSHLERLEGLKRDEAAQLAMEECEKTLLAIVNALPDIAAKPKPEPEPKPEEVKA